MIVHVNSSKSLQDLRNQEGSSDLLEFVPMPLLTRQLSQHPVRLFLPNVKSFSIKCILEEKQIHEIEKKGLEVDEC